MLILVNGAPGAGKTTLVRALVAELGVRLIEKDAIKEALFDVLGAGDRQWSRKLSDAAFETMFRLAADLPAEMIEGNFRPEHRTRVLELDAEPVEIFCHCSQGELVRRWRGRQRHPGHHEPSEEEVRRWAGWEPLNVGVLIRVDTGGPVDVEQVLAQLREHVHLEEGDRARGDHHPHQRTVGLGAPSDRGRLHP